MFYNHTLTTRLALLFFIFIISLPISVHFLSWSSFDQNLWAHLLETFLPESFINTILLIFFVSYLTLILGTILAFVCSRINFLGAKFFSFFLLTPLCFSKFVMGFSFISLFEHGGPIQSTLRFFGYNFSSYFSNNQFSLLVVVLTLSLYPYVFLAVVLALQHENLDELEAAECLGAKFFTRFKTITFPHLKPYLVRSIALVALEVYGDFGASSLFGVNTISTSIYKVWSSLFSLETASQIATFAIILVFFLYYFEGYSNHSPPNNNMLKTFEKKNVKKNISILLFLFCFFIFFISFVVPLGWMLLMVMKSNDTILFDVYSVVCSSLLICLLTSLIVMVVSCLVNIKERAERGKNYLLHHLIKFGYAVPPTVIAIGVISVFSWLTNYLDNIFNGFNFPMLSCLIFGLTVRFMIIGHSYLSSSFLSINYNLDEMGFLCGASKFNVFKRIHFPLISKGLCVGFVVGFIDCLKETPITLMTRPIGWDTFSVKVFEYTSESDWVMAVYPSLALSFFVFLLLLVSNSFIGENFFSS